MWAILIVYTNKYTAFGVSFDETANNKTDGLISRDWGSHGTNLSQLILFSRIFYVVIYVQV